MLYVSYIYDNFFIYIKNTVRLIHNQAYNIYIIYYIYIYILYIHISTMSLYLLLTIGVGKCSKVVTEYRILKTKGPVTLSC